MAAVCIRIPEVNGEESILYARLYEFTNKNRPLTNYLYALASLDLLRSSVGAENLNSQGEISPDYLIKELKIDRYIGDESRKSNALKSLDAIARGGVPKDFDSIEEIKDRVIQFNDDKQNENFAAKIKLNDKGKYNIVVEMKDDTNFMVNNQYKAGEKQIERILLELEKLNSNNITKLDIHNLSNQALRAFNITNARFLVDALNSIKDAYSNNGKRNKSINLSEDMWRLMYDLREDSDVAQRLNKQFGDKLSFVLKIVMSNQIAFSKDLDIPLDILDKLDRETNVGKINFRDIELFVKQIKDVLNDDKINLRKLENDVDQIFSNEITDDISLIRKTLKDLYSKYDLDKDTFIKAKEDLNTFEDILDGIISSLNTSIEIMATRGVSENDKLRSTLLKRLDRLRRDLKSKRKAKSVISFLQEISKFIDSVDIINNFNNLYKDIPNLSVEKLNEAASQILYIKDRIAFLLPIVERLMLNDVHSGELLDGVSEEDRKAIWKYAGEANIILNQLKNDAISKLFDLVQSYLTKYWGNENGLIVKPDGTIVVLADLLKNADNGPLNIFDRWLSSMTEVHDEVISTFGYSIKSMHEVRDLLMNDVFYTVRVATEELNGNTNFMFKKSNSGIWYIDNDVDWDKYYEEKQKYKLSLKDQGLSKYEISDLMETWENEHLGDYEFEPVEIDGLTFGVYQRDKDGNIMYDKDGKPMNIVVKGMPIFRKERSIKDSMTLALLKYYYSMMDIKLNFDRRLEQHGVKTYAFRPPQITSSFADNLLNKSFSDLVKFLKDKFVDSMKIREDETDYGVDDYDELTDANGAVVRRLPTFYINKLSDQERLSMDFSRGMMAYSGMAINFLLMADRVGIMELSKDLLMNRLVQKSVGGVPVFHTVSGKSGRVKEAVTVPSSQTNIGDYLNDLIDSKFYGKHHKVERKILGKDSSLIASSLTKYTSATGLGANLPGAIANLLVGKLLMLIETNARDFFGYKDYKNAIKLYHEMMPGILKDVYSNNKQSKLGLLMDKFNVLGDFYEKLKTSGFYKNDISKIIGNSSLYFMYGMGEHLLHALTMLAVLNNVKVYDNEGKEYSLLEVFDVEKNGKNAKLVVKDGYKIKDPESGQLKDLTDSYLTTTIKGRILYANNSMHGAFSEDDKGLLHMWALGRLFMNFRQWMPAHYARRFNTLHWDATLGDYREGYYCTCWNFVKKLCKDLKNHEANILTQYKSLNRWEKANMRRTIMEVGLLTIFAALSKMDWGNDPDNRTWATAMLKLQAKRLYMEISASVPVNIFNPLDFFNNIINTLQSPMAAINTITDWMKILDIPTLVKMERLKSGSHKGELVYIRNVERAIPYYDQVYKWLHMASDNDLFVMFNRKMF